MICFSPLLRAKAELQPFWKKSWFIFLVIVLAIAAAVGIIVYLVYPANSSSYTIEDISISNTHVPKSRVSSVATTNGDYFKKCAPAVTCNPSDKYRSYNGSCNNLQNPNWGAALTPFYRLMNAEFSDGNINNILYRN